ncbi:ATP-binding cassette domain-containing protein [bacterium]|nr:ATP-binding cassette domain-containing protein [bacterium]
MLKLHSLALTINEKPLFSDFSLSLKQGEKAVLRGDSGSGKSTLFKAMLGLLSVESGSIIINGITLSDDTVSQVRQQISYLPQAIHPFKEESVFDFIMRPFSYKINRDKAPDSDTFMKNISGTLGQLGVDIGNPKEKATRNLSGGEMQRVALVRALFLSRPILFLDEATSALDPKNIARVVKVIAAIPHITILAISHDSVWEDAGFRVIPFPGGEI